MLAVRVAASSDESPSQKCGRKDSGQRATAKVETRHAGSKHGLRALTIQTAFVGRRCLSESATWVEQTGRFAATGIGARLESLCDRYRSTTKNRRRYRVLDQRE